MAIPSPPSQPFLGSCRYRGIDKASQHIRHIDRFAPEKLIVPSKSRPSNKSAHHRNVPRSKRRPRRRRSRRHDRSASAAFSFARMKSYFVLVAILLRQRLYSAIRVPRRSARRDQVFVDGSFSNVSAPDDICVGGIGVWIPSRRLAFSVQVSVKTSMEAEILALLAGAMVAKYLKLNQPVIYSDCKSAVATGIRHLDLERSQPLLRLPRRLFQLSGELSAYRDIYSVLSVLRGTLVWRPREENREADLVSSIGTRHGCMGIQLLGSRDFSHALNDILSNDPVRISRISPAARRRQRRGAKLTAMTARQPTPFAHFRRESRSIIQSVLSGVA